MIEDGSDHHWQWYKDYFSLSYIRYFATWFAVAPIIARVFGSSGHESPICIDADCIVVRVDLPFSWWILWIGSVSFITAFALYHYYCPAFIKRYSSYSDYLAAMHSPRWTSWEALRLITESQASPKAYDIDKFVSRLKEKGYAVPDEGHYKEPKVTVEKSQSVLHFSYQDNAYRLAMPPKNGLSDSDRRYNDIAVHEVVWEIFGRYASSHRNIRFIITYLVRASWIAVIAVMIQNIFFVIRYAISI